MRMFGLSGLSKPQTAILNEEKSQEFHFNPKSTITSFVRVEFYFLSAAEGKNEEGERNLTVSLTQIKQHEPNWFSH